MMCGNGLALVRDGIETDIPQFAEVAFDRGGLTEAVPIVSSDGVWTLLANYQSYWRPGQS